MTIAEEKDWSNAIGGVFINFGIIELASLRWAELSSDALMRDLMIDMPLARRIVVIRQLVDRSPWAAARKARANELWSEVAQLSQIRNTIAHNPFHAGTADHPVQGIINVKMMKGLGPYEVPLIGFAQIVTTARRAGELGRQLHTFWIEEH